MARTPTPVTEPDCALLMLPSSSIAAVVVFRSTYTSAKSAPREGAPFEVALSGAGAFPSPARPRVLWLGVTDGALPLLQAAERLRTALRQRGFTLEERPFRPHLTFARVRPRGERSAKRALAAIAPGEFARWTTREACLMQSVLGKGGATHTVLRAFPFR